MASTEGSRLTIHEAGDALLLLVGEIDVATAPELARYLENDPRVRVLDMAQVTFIDSSGLKVLVIANRSRDAADRITLRAPSGAVRRVVDIAGMAEWLGLTPDRRTHPTRRVGPCSLRSTTRRRRTGNRSRPVRSRMMPQTPFCSTSATTIAMTPSVIVYHVTWSLNCSRNR